MLKKVALFFITAVYIVINIWWLKADVRLASGDPPWHFISSLKIWQLLSHFSLQEMRHLVLGSVHPPLVGILVRPFYFLFGENLDTAVLAMNLIFLPMLVFSISKIIQFYINKPRQVVLGSLMLLTCPGVIFLSRLYFLDLPLMAMVALSFYLLISTREFMDRWYAIALAIALALGNLTKLPFLAYIAAPLIFLLPRLNSKERIINFFIFLVIFLIITTAWYLPSYKTILLLSNTQFVAFQTYGLHIFRYFFPGIIVYLALIFLFRKMRVGARVKRFAVGVGICALLFFYMPRADLLRAYAWDFLADLSVFINGGIGIINFSILCLGAFLTSIRRRCPALIILWFLVPMVIFFQWCRHELRYILPCLPPMVVFILIALENLHKKLRNIAYSVIILNSIFLLIAYTWPIKLLPRELVLIRSPKIFLLTANFWTNGREPVYGPVYPQGQSGVFYIHEFLDGIKNSGIRDGEIIWLLAGNHHIFGNASLSYYSTIRKMNLKFWSLYPNVFEHDPVARISKSEFRYFVDIKGFNGNGMVESARNFIKANQDKFQIIFERDIPGDSAIVVYKKI